MYYESTAGWRIEASDSLHIDTKTPELHFISQNEKKKHFCELACRNRCESMIRAHSFALNMNLSIEFF